MELSVEPVTVPHPANAAVRDDGSAAPDWLRHEESLEAWNEAYRRVEAYFSALRVENKLLLSSLVFKILGRANERLVNGEPDRPPVELAAEETDRFLVDWFRRVLNEPGAETGSDRLSARGRMALLEVEREVPWRQFLVSGEPMPDDFVEKMRRAYLHADPEFRFVEMRPRPIDLGLMQVASDTFEKMGRWRATAVWLFWIGCTLLMTAIFFATR